MLKTYPLEFSITVAQLLECLNEKINLTKMSLRLNDSGVMIDVSMPTFSIVAQIILSDIDVKLNTIYDKNEEGKNLIHNSLDEALTECLPLKTE